MSAGGRHPDDQRGAGEHGGGPLVLIVDDEDALVRGLRLTFEREGFRVLAAGDGPAAVRLARTERPDLIILDLMLPGIGGLEVCRRLRGDADPSARSVPIIILTARDDDVDKIVGLEVGADDYVTKPFQPRELVARARAVLKRRGSVATDGPAAGAVSDAATNAAEAQRLAPILDFGSFRLNRLSRELEVRDQMVNCPAKEFDLLWLMASHPDRVFSREELLERVWGYQYYGDLRTVDVHIRRIRQKIEARPDEPRFVQTVWGIGYKFKISREDAGDKGPV